MVPGGLPVKEQAVCFQDNARLVGVITDPPRAAGPAGRPAVVMMSTSLVARQGPSRVLVDLSRALAADGSVVLRFDFSGVGDSGARLDHAPFFPGIIGEARAAMDCLRDMRGAERFWLMGYCTGGWTAFRTALEDPRVAGVVLINSHSHLHARDGEEQDAIQNRVVAHHYRRMALASSFRAKNLFNALTGNINRQAAGRLLARFDPRRLLQDRPTPAPPLAGRAAELLRALAAKGTRVLHVHSEGDEGLDYLLVAAGRELRRWRETGLLQLEVIRGADHPFTLLWSQERLIEIVREWARDGKHPVSRFNAHESSNPQLPVARQPSQSMGT
jgi:pimeloyl-ACP methyl ester carboxylesterase